jgi:DNA adenine methylase
VIFRYPGGKSKKSIREKIMSYFPNNYSEFRDAMVGGGGIFFAVPITKKRWINDIDDNLMSVYLALRDNSKDFIATCRAIQPSQDNEPLAPAKNGKCLYNARLKKIFDELSETDQNSALKYLFVNRTVWGGRVNYNLKSRMYFSNPNGWNVIHTNKMEQAANCLSNVKITCGSYKDLLINDGEDVVVYLDPPYFVNTNFDNMSKLYKHNFEEKDHLEMHDLVKQCKHKVVISYDNHPFIKKLYKDFNRQKYQRWNKEEWTYCGTGVDKKKLGKELIITNF